MKLKRTGHYFELPIVGLTIQKIVFDGMLTLIFNDTESSFLELHLNFKVMQYNQVKAISPKDKEGLVLFYEHYQEPIKEAKTDGSGNLWLTFKNGTQITVEDGPYENWHYTKRCQAKPMESLYVHGGIEKQYSETPIQCCLTLLQSRITNRYYSMWREDNYVPYGSQIACAETKKPQSITF